DLVGCQDEDELAIIGARLLTSAAELALLERRQWIGHGKWLLRRLRGADPHLARKLIDAYRSLVVRNDTRPLEQITRRVLDQSGGPLMEGYHRAAPPE
ncbi:MAG: nucleotidyltransferase domain-containing protein, partial [Actinobacteria bacterium]|nr:nucleotidyltransferase domain-containing protein [Actinomycetota bacterium]